MNSMIVLKEDESESMLPEIMTMGLGCSQYARIYLRRQVSMLQEAECGCPDILSIDSLFFQGLLFLDTLALYIMNSGLP